MKKTFEVDYDNPTELKKLISTLQKRRKNVLRAKGYAGVYFQGSAYHIDNVLPILDGMLKDVPAEAGVFYVYLHCDGSRKLDILNDVRNLWIAQKFNVTHTPIYVGKGAGARYLDLVRDGAHRKLRADIRKKGADIIPVKIAEGMSEESALRLEGALIDILGCKHLSKNGMLTNLDEGHYKEERRAFYSADAWKVLKRNGFVVT